MCLSRCQVDLVLVMSCVVGNVCAIFVWRRWNILSHSWRCNKRRKYLAWQPRAVLSRTASPWIRARILVFEDLEHARRTSAGARFCIVEYTRAMCVPLNQECERRPLARREQKGVPSEKYTSFTHIYVRIVVKLQ